MPRRKGDPARGLVRVRKGRHDGAPLGHKWWVQFWGVDEKGRVGLHGMRLHDHPSDARMDKWMVEYAIRYAVKTSRAGKGRRG